LVETFRGFLSNSFDKRQIAACPSSKELCANLKMYQSTGRGCTLLSSKEFCKFKSFWCEAAKNLLIQNKMRGRV
jgi:hypothetical protein